MPDERYEWLDRDAAERLLRGEPLKAVDDHARYRAERLAQTLDALAAAGSSRWSWHPVPRAPGAVSAELPGEANALAAFRAARHGRSGMIEDNGVITDATRASGAGGPGAGDEPVLLGRPEPARWARPVRFGLAAALAGCMLGGVAVAAGTGVLPSPFGGQEHPAPAASVSGPPASPDRPLSSVAPSPSASAGTDATPDPSPTSSGPADGPAREPVSPGGAPGGGDSESRETWWAQAVAACRDHRAGTLDAARQRRLEQFAKGAERVDRFCDKVLDHKAGDGAKGGNGNKGGSDKGGEDNGGDDQGGDGDGDRGSGDGEGVWEDPGPEELPSFAPSPVSSPEASPTVEVSPSAEASSSVEASSSSDR
ncbi:hypothetical protein ACFVT5_02120 [Streptomyces sp. NPDC058001]|uniref:hypothetical protein n=1 Tax=Streptomyces sp. NPDC058001 TaxID=3346300 RepID=UPI0036E4C2D7